MAEFSRLCLTPDGRALLADALGGAALTFTRVAASETAVSPEALASLGALSGVRCESAVTRVVREEGGVCVEATLTGAALTEGCTVRTLGLYARKAGCEEVLYAAACETQGGFYLPANGSESTASVEVRLFTALADAPNVSLFVSDAAAARKTDVLALTEALAAHGAACAAQEAGAHGLRCRDGQLEAAVPGEDGAGSAQWVSLGGGFAAGTAAPANTKALWIDTTPGTGGLKYHNGTAWVHVPVAYT